MKLAEALLLRAEYQKKLDGLQQRMMTNLKVQENDKPYENPDVLLAEAMKLNEDTCQLIKKINKKNTEAALPNGQTIAEALADRDMQMKKRQLLVGIASEAGQKDYRLTHAEVKMCVTVDIGKLQKQIDSLSQQFRQLDTMIQGQNWTVDLE